MRASIGRKLTVSFMLVAMLVGLLGIVGYSNMKETRKQIGLMQEESHTQVILIEMKSQILEGIEEAFAYPLLNDPQEKSEFYQKLSRFDTSAASFSAGGYLQQRGQSEEFELFNQIVSAKNALATAAGTMFESYEREGTINPSHVADFEAEIDIVIPLIDRFLEIEKEEVAEAQLDIQATIASAERLTVIVVLVAVVLAITLGVFVSRSISIPINRLKIVAEELGKGKLDVSANVESGDEIGSLADSFNQMAAALRLGEANRQEAQTQLAQAHDELENRVMERTLALEKARVIAEEATQAKSRFLAHMSHELRTPLNAVIGYSELLIDMAQEEGKPAFIPNLERITASGGQLLTLVNDILDLARIEAGKMDLHIEGFGISSLIEDVRGIWETLIQANGNTFSVDCPEDIGSMQTDQVKVRQMLFNLLSNASKFTENGDIYLSVSRESIDGDDWIVFKVTDTGIGIAPNAVEDLFQPFAQADSSTVRRYGGSGLGLSLCRSFSQMMGGSITLETKWGAGSTFMVRLPAIITGPALDSIKLEISAAVDLMYAGPDAVEKAQGVQI